jgi:hypothetical protein
MCQKCISPYFTFHLFKGYGTYSSANGDKYFGQWTDGKAEGFGIFYYAINNSDLVQICHETSTSSLTFRTYKLNPV